MSEHYSFPMNARHVLSEETTPVLSTLSMGSSFACFGLGLISVAGVSRRGAALCAAAATPAEFFNALELNDISDVNYGVLAILALSSLSVYGLIIAGWASNSKYAFLGALRSAAQMISYEVSISLVLLPVVALAGSLNFTKIVLAQTKTI